MPRSSGALPSVARTDPRSGVSRRLGESNAQDLAWGLCQPQDGARAGKHNAVWAFVNVAAGAGLYDLAHRLGAKAVAVELVDLRYPQGAAPIPHASAQAIRQSEWTETMAKVDITVVAGNLAGCTAVFLVRGE